MAANADLLACVAAVGAAWAATAMPPGDLLRVLLVLPILLFVPGYLALQAIVGSALPRDRRRQAMAALGLSPVLVGLAALATAVAPGGFRLAAIANAVLVATIVLAGAALARRIMASDVRARQGLAVATARPARPLPIVRTANPPTANAATGARPDARNPEVPSAAPLSASRDGATGAVGAQAAPPASGPRSEVGAMRFERI